MAGVRRFEKLDCWQLADQLKQELYAVCRKPEVDGDRKFQEQVRDAAASAPRNIAEGFGRKTDKDFARFLDTARGSLNECLAHAKDAHDRGYVSGIEYERLRRLCDRAIGAVAGLQRHLRRAGNAG